MHKNNQLEDVVLGHTVVSHHEKPKLSCWFGYNWGRKPEISGKEDLSFLGPEGGIPRASELCHKILGLGHVFFPHKFNTNLRKHHIFWWEQQVTRQNPWMMTASCQAYPAYLKKMPVLCAYFRMSNHQPSVIHELMIWESQNSFESSTFWICKLDDPKPALIHKLKSSTRMSYSNKFYCFFENGTTQFFISMNIASRPDPITFWYILFVYHPWCHAEDAEDS